jgi:hypothetical protein
MTTDLDELIIDRQAAPGEDRPGVMSNDPTPTP